MKKKFLWLVMFLLWTMACSLWTCSYAAVPHLINYQGRLTDTSSKPLEGSYAVNFKIYDAETAGNLLWEETQSGVVVQKGVFSVLLGSVTNLNIAFDKQYYLEIKVGSEVMSPRQRITSAGYAIRAEKAEGAETLGGKTQSDFALAVDITSTPTVNKAVKLDSSAKLPVSALKVYDSGWFVVTVNTNYTKTHNLGTTACIVKIYLAQNGDGSGYFADATTATSTTGGIYSMGVCSLTSTQVVIRGNNPSYIACGKKSDGADWYTASAYARIVILALG